jgi:hypothetical protein
MQLDNAMNIPSNVPAPKKRPSATKRLKPVEDPEAKRESTDVATKLRERIGRLLATSPELVVVRRIWLRRFRVNVLRPNPKPGSLNGTRSIAQSYFVRTNDQGEIVRCEPLLPKQESPSTP